MWNYRWCPVSPTRYPRKALLVGLGLAVMSGCGGSTEPTCEPAIGIEMLAGSTINGQFILTMGLDSITQTQVGPQVFEFLTDVLIRGKPTGEASAIWAVRVPLPRLSTFTFQLGGAQAVGDTLRVSGAPNGPVGRGAALGPGGGVKFRLENRLFLGNDGVDSLAAEDGSFTFRQVAPMIGRIQATLKSEHRTATGTIGADLAFGLRECAANPP